MLKQWKFSNHAAKGWPLLDELTQFQVSTVPEPCLKALRGLKALQRSRKEAKHFLQDPNPGLRTPATPGCHKHDTQADPQEASRICLSNGPKQVLHHLLVSAWQADWLDLIDCGVVQVASDSVFKCPAIRGCAMGPPIVHCYEGPNIGRVVADNALNGVLCSMLGRHPLPHALHHLKANCTAFTARATKHGLSALSTETQRNVGAHAPCSAVDSGSCCYHGACLRMLFLRQQNLPLQGPVACLIAGQEAQMDVSIASGAAAADARLSICAGAGHCTVAHAPRYLHSNRVSRRDEGHASTLWQSRASH